MTFVFVRFALLSSTTLLLKRTCDCDPVAATDFLALTVLSCLPQLPAATQSVTEQEEEDDVSAYFRFTQHRRKNVRGRVVPLGRWAHNLCWDDGAVTHQVP